MAIVTVNISSTTKFLAPPGTIAGAFRVKLANGPAELVQDVDGLQAVFPDVPPGNWIPSAMRIDTAASQIGNSVTGDTFNVPTPGVLVDIPTSITVTVG